MVELKLGRKMVRGLLVTRLTSLQQWASSRAAPLWTLFAVACYVYVILLLKAEYLMNRKLERIGDMSVKTSKMVYEIQQLDQVLRQDISDAEEPPVPSSNLFVHYDYDAEQ